MKLTYHIAVQREVDDACAWYDERKDHLGDEFLQEVERVLARIADTAGITGTTQGSSEAISIHDLLPHPPRPRLHFVHPT